jgi:fatty acid/phospholipid biosynthesis enzyme
VSGQQEASSVFRDLDRVRLTETITEKGRTLFAGLEGTIVYCHGSEAFEVEFQGISDFFQVSQANLVKA